MLDEILYAPLRGDHMLTAQDVAAVISGRVRVVDAMRQQKLLYYAQAWHLATTNKPLFGDPIEAWPEGPVVPEVLNAFRRRRPKDGESQRDDPARIKLDKFSSDLVSLVTKSYGSMQSDELDALVQVEMPWREARANPSAAKVISLNSMTRFFRDHRWINNQQAIDIVLGGIISPLCPGSKPADSEAVLASFYLEYPLDEKRWAGGAGV